LNPLALVYGRVSANVEYLLAPHHALYLSPSILAWSANRGDPKSVIANGFGFASESSRGLAIELGYHYWIHWHRSLRGLYAGPALLLGNTSDATAGDPTHRQSYWGAAFDVGYQDVMPSGFTWGFGAGLEGLRMAGSTGFAPRLLGVAGWSF